MTQRTEEDWLSCMLCQATHSVLTAERTVREGKKWEGKGKGRRESVYWYGIDMVLVWYMYDIWYMYGI